MTLTESVPALPFDRDSILEISPTYLWLQAERTIAQVRTPVGDPAWLVTRYEDVKALLADERLGLTHPDPQRAPRASHSAVLGGAMPGHESEREDHARKRQVMARSFAARRMQALQPRVQQFMDGLLDDLAAGEQPADLHQALSVPLPALVICELLGVPYADRELFQTFSEEATDTGNAARAQAGAASLYGYMADLIGQQRHRPGENVIGDLVAARDAGRLSEQEMVEVAMGLLGAGYETTMPRIDCGVLLLLAHPGQRAALVGDSSLVPGAVEEVLRLAAPSRLSGLPRYAAADLEIGGVTIRAGELVLLAIQPANRDRAVFDDPCRFDITRVPNPHLTFGFGSRFCVGAGLARIELRVVFGTLFRRFPALRLAVPLEAVPLRRNALMGGVAALPVVW